MTPDIAGSRMAVIDSLKDRQPQTTDDLLSTLYHEPEDVDEAIGQLQREGEIYKSSDGWKITSPRGR